MYKTLCCCFFFHFFCSRRTHNIFCCWRCCCLETVVSLYCVSVAVAAALRFCSGCSCDDERRAREWVSECYFAFSILRFGILYICMEYVHRHTHTHTYEHLYAYLQMQCTHKVGTLSPTTTVCVYVENRYTSTVRKIYRVLLLNQRL